MHSKNFTIACFVWLYAKSFLSFPFIGVIHITIIRESTGKLASRMCHLFVYTKVEYSQLYRLD